MPSRTRTNHKPKPTVEPVKQKPSGKSVADFRASHDKSFIVPQKIKAGLKALGGGWAYEVEFLKLAGLSTTDLANHRDLFAEHIVLVDRTKRVWAGTKDLASKLREMAA